MCLNWLSFPWLHGFYPVSYTHLDVYKRQVINRYIDQGITGTQVYKRDAFMRMMEDAKQQKFDLIVTREVCRFARNTVDALVCVRQLAAIGIEVYFVNDNIWTLDGDGELRLTIMATMAQEESRKISERSLAGQRVSREKGVLYGNGNIFGYTRNKLTKQFEIDPDQAETVKMIFDLYDSGMGETLVAKELTRLGRKNGVGTVSYTHLDVYKRQESSKEVTLLCENELMRVIIDHYGEDAAVDRYDDTHFTAKIEVNPSGTFYGWIFKFKGKIKILSPKECITEMQQIAQEFI